MTERHKSFGLKPKVKTPVTFDIDGETFTAMASIPGARLLDFIADADSNDGARAAQALVEFIEGAIVEEDRDRFADLIRDPDKAVDIETLGEICEFLVEQYASRPTESSKPPRATRARSGRGSTVTSSTTA